MGAADIVPGVSGGTMAFILGIYEDLLEGIKRVNVVLARKVLRFDLKGVFAYFPWQFFLFLVGGLAGAVLVLAGALHHAYENHPVRLYAFFFGLVLASAVLLSRDVPWNLRRVLGLAAGSVLGYLAVTVAPVEQMGGNFAVHAFCGALAITAMILPGISGSFILLILGKYDVAITAVKELDVLTLLPFAVGAVLGLLAFTRVLSWLLSRWHHLAVAALIGFMLGSLRKLFPWKEAVNTIYRDGEAVVLQDRLIWPELSAETGLALGLMLVGIVVICAIEWVRVKKVS